MILTALRQQRFICVVFVNAPMTEIRSGNLFRLKRCEIVFVIGINFPQRKLEFTSEAFGVG